MLLLFAVKLKTSLHFSHALSVLSCVDALELSKSSYSSKPNMNFIKVGLVVVQPLATQGGPQVSSRPFYAAFGLLALMAKDPRALVFHPLCPLRVRAIPLAWAPSTSR